jgi:4-amino-4-deoxy-L-arabinose transferase-like glycosyltransferase
VHAYGATVDGATRSSSPPQPARRSWRRRFSSAVCAPAAPDALALYTRIIRFLAILLSVALTAFAIRLTYNAAKVSTDGPDSVQYRALAQNLRAHHAFSLDSSPPFGPTIRRAPLYPLFLALVAGSGDGISGERARTWQAVLDSLVAAMICLILHGLVRLRWAVAAGMVYAFHPAAMLYASSILSESLFTFLATLAVTILLFGIRRDTLFWIFAAGLLMGLAALARPVAAPFFIIVAAAIWWSRRSIRRPVAMAAVFSAATLAVMTPWIVRSSVAAGRFVLVNATGPVNFALATAAEPWSLNDQSSIWQTEHYWRENPCGHALREARTPPESARADQLCLQVALQDLRKNPRYYIRNRISQLVHFPLTSFDVATGNATSFQTALQQRAWTVLSMKLGLFTLFSLVPLLAGVAGLFVARGAVEKTLCGALWLFTIVIHLPGYLEYRYFFPAVPMLLITAAFAFDWLERALTPEPNP